MSLSKNEQPGQGIRIAKLGRPHGISGEIRLYSLSDIPGRFEKLDEVQWEKKDTSTKRLKVVGLRPGKRFFLIRFEDYKTPEKAQELSNGYLVVGRQERPLLPKGRYYIDDIIGLKVMDLSGQEVGILKDVLQPGPHDIYEIKTATGELLVPVIDDIVKDINLKTGTMTIKVPEYL